jgi:hypothetical protein
MSVAVLARGDDLNRFPARRHQNFFAREHVDAILEAIPEGAEMALLLQVDQELGDACCNFFLRHVGRVSMSPCRFA